MSVRGCVMISAARAGGNIQKMDRLLDRRAAADAQIRAVFPQRRVQRGKHIAANVGIAAQVLLDALGSAAFWRCAYHAAINGPLQRADLQALGQVPQLREFRRKVPVDEDQLAGRARNAKLLDLLRGNGDAALLNALERGLRQRREIGEPPVLVVRGRESLGVESRPAILAQLPQPYRIALLPQRDQFAIRF